LHKAIDSMQTTQWSLIVRLQDPRDQEAWMTFSENYHAAIMQSLLRKGLMQQDAEDIAQQVMMSVANTLSKRPHDPDRAKFRTWLERVIRNAAINALRDSSKRVVAKGGTDSLVQLSSLPSQDDASELLAQEYQNQLVRIASKAIEGEFQPDTWQMFWRSTVLGQPIEQVANALGKQVGSVYASRSRVMRRLRMEIERIQNEQG
jgi:RNA polymerase sigma-70 factor (ECF subfamily)